MVMTYRYQFEQLFKITSFIQKNLAITMYFEKIAQNQRLDPIKQIRSIWGAGLSHILFLTV